MNGRDRKPPAFEFNGIRTSCDFDKRAELPLSARGDLVVSNRFDEDGVTISTF